MLLAALGYHGALRAKVIAGVRFANASLFLGTARREKAALFPRKREDASQGLQAGASRRSALCAFL
ncbi:hypothetical protein AGMMS50256_10680 [Betaproteobacteria bacterium]|nr:hypothetical protein AGMMS50256_10680 [Betaproteobacteria bacterium]